MATRENQFCTPKSSAATCQFPSVQGPGSPCSAVLSDCDAPGPQLCEGHADPQAPRTAAAPWPVTVLTQLSQRVLLRVHRRLNQRPCTPAAPEPTSPSSRMNITRAYLPLDFFPYSLSPTIFGFNLFSL